MSLPSVLDIAANSSSRWGYAHSVMDPKSPFDVQVKEEDSPRNSNAAQDRISEIGEPGEHGINSPHDRILCDAAPCLTPETETLVEHSIQGNRSSKSRDSVDNWSERSGFEGQEEQILSAKGEEDDALGDEFDEEHEQYQTAAERNSARRKLKRFRLTHQQTRFLMSEFVKQPHPDAAHRDRLSREIPGLTPRQVQVWFQNRRAKIKRLNVEDRDRVIQMRAVPENFDNVQALHSPYGAVHGLGPSGEPGNLGYGDRLDSISTTETPRPEANKEFSPTGLPPAFEGIEINLPAATDSENSQAASTPSNDRYSSFGNQMTSFSRSSGLYFGLQEADTRPSQSPPAGGVLPRTLADSVQSPLRNEWTWDNDRNERIQLGEDRTADQFTYRMGSTAAFDPRGYGVNANTYHEGHGVQYVNSFHNVPPGRGRIRGFSATSARNPEAEHQRHQPERMSTSPRPYHSQRTLGSSPHHSRSSVYTTSYPPAPLTAPINTYQPKMHPTLRGHSVERSHFGQYVNVSAATPTDFTWPRQDIGVPEFRAPMRDSYSGYPFLVNQSQDDSGI